MTLSKDSDCMFGNGSWFIVLILFFLGGFGGWGRGDSSAIQGAMTRAELYEGLNSQNMFSEFRSLQNEMTNGYANIQQSLNCGFNGVQMGLNNGFNSVNSNIAESRYAMQNCCCEIKNAIHSEGETTRALIQENTIQKLRDKVADKDRELLSTGLVTAQTIQTNNLENFIRNLLDARVPVTTPTT